MAVKLPPPLPAAWQSRLREPKKTKSVGLRISEGERNDAVFRMACRLRSRGMRRDEARTLLDEFNSDRCVPPLPEREVESCLKSAFKYPASYELNDRGNAQRFCDYVDGDVRYVIEQRTFIVWTGERWQADTDDLDSLAIMKESNERIWLEVQACTDPNRHKALVRHARTSQNTGRLKSSLESVKSEPDMKMSALQLDCDTMLIGVQNGVVDLRTGKRRDGEREDFVTKLAGTEFAVDAKCDRWLRFLNEITGKDQDLIRYLQQLVGYTLTGDTSEQILLFAFGGGANGKTVFLETIKSLLGDYGKNLRTEVLMGRTRSGGASEDEARLLGARYVAVNETAEGMRFNEALVKDLTGGDTITARRLYENSFEFVPQFKLWMRGNNQPGFSGSDGGMARRIKLIPFLQTIPPEKRDRELRNKLLEELPGILNWAIAGCIDWKQNGLREPTVVTAATLEYISEMDSVGTFLDEQCEAHPKYFTSPTNLKKAYRSWCEQNDVEPAGWPQVTRALRQRGFKDQRRRIKGQSSRAWVGIRPRSPVRILSRKSGGEL